MARVRFALGLNNLRRPSCQILGRFRLMLNNTHLDFAIEMGLKKITWAGHNNTLKIVLTKRKNHNNNNYTQ